jgi:hypothetical protein
MHGGDELGHYRGESAAAAEVEAQQVEAFLGLLAPILDPLTLAALKARRDLLLRLMRMLDAHVFAADPEADRNARLQAAVAALQGLPDLARALRAAESGRRSGASRKGCIADRDTIIRELGETPGATSESIRRKLQRLKRTGKLPGKLPSARTIRRVLGTHA